MNYCETCGAALEETVSIVGFEPLDGRPRYAFRRRCPRRKWWNSGHTDVKFIGLSRAAADASSDFEWHGW